MNESRIEVCPSGNIICIGEDATRLFAAMQVRSAMRLLMKGIQPTRGYTKAKAMNAAALYTKKVYLRGQIMQAHNDLTEWINAMQAALPIIQED